MTDYVLDNAADQAGTRMTLLDRIYGPWTTSVIDWVQPRPGWVSWEIGAGSGAAALAIAERTPGGIVYATDLDTRWIPDEVLHHVVVLQHDVMRDPPPAHEFDLIHMRMVASHLPRWGVVLADLVARLVPGGWLIVEDLDPMLPYQPAAVDERDERINAVGRAFTKVLAGRGGRPTLGRFLARDLAGAGLGDIHAVGTIISSTAGDAPSQLMAANVEQMRDALAEHVRPGAIDAYLADLRRPDTTFNMPVFWQVAGQKAGAR